MQARYRAFSSLLWGVAVALTWSGLARAQLSENDPSGDVFIEGQLCVSDDNDCGTVENFIDAVEIKVKDSIPGIYFENTTGSMGDETDWQIKTDFDQFRLIDRGAAGAGTNEVFNINAGAPEDALTILSNGNVGLSTATPSASVHVKRSDGTAKVFVQEATDVTLARILLELTNDGEPQFRMSNRAAGASWFFTTSGVGNFKLSKVGSGAEELALDGSGNLMLRGNLTACATALVGPDTCNPDNSTFPDYVFEPDYPLMPLPEVEQFITKEKHLPNVISADDAKENGINMTKLQLQLLEKVEELTLYTIAQEKKLEKAHIHIERLQEQLKEKNKQIAELQQHTDERNAEVVRRLSRLEALFGSAPTPD